MLRAQPGNYMRVLNNGKSMRTTKQTCACTQPRPDRQEAGKFRSPGVKIWENFQRYALFDDRLEAVHTALFQQELRDRTLDDSPRWTKFFGQFRYFNVYPATWRYVESSPLVQGSILWPVLDERKILLIPPTKMAVNDLLDHCMWCADKPMCDFGSLICKQEGLNVCA